jgi:hypothetical protein
MTCFQIPWLLTVERFPSVCPSLRTVGRVTILQATKGTQIPRILLMTQELCIVGMLEVRACQTNIHFLAAVRVSSVPFHFYSRDSWLSNNFSP